MQERAATTGDDLLRARAVGMALVDMQVAGELDAHRSLQHLALEVFQRPRGISLVVRIGQLIHPLWLGHAQDHVRLGRHLLRRVDHDRAFFLVDDKDVPISCTDLGGIMRLSADYDAGTGVLSVHGPDGLMRSDVVERGYRIGETVLRVLAGQDRFRTRSVLLAPKRGKR